MGLRIVEVKSESPLVFSKFYAYNDANPRPTKVALRSFLYPNPFTAEFYIVSDLGSFTMEHS